MIIHQVPLYGSRNTKYIVGDATCVYVARYLLKCYLRSDCSNRILEIVLNPLFSFTIYIMSMEWRSAGVPHFTQQMYVRRSEANPILNSAEELRKLKDSDILVIEEKAPSLCFPSGHYKSCLAHPYPWGLGKLLTIPDISLSSLLQKLFRDSL